MKRTAIIVSLLTVLILMSCKTFKKLPAQPVPAAEPLSSIEYLSGGDRTALLSQYPIKILPLYRCITVTGCEFETTKSDQKFLLGTDVYTLTYTTKADQDEVMAFYNKLVIPNEEISFEGALSGNVNDNPVDITLNRENDTAPFEVMIQIGLTPQQKTDTNPYFGDYTGNVTALGDKNILYSQRFRLFYQNGKLNREYSINYISKLSLREFNDLYKNALGTEKNFVKLTNGYENAFSFTKDNAIYKVSLSRRSDSDTEVYLTIVCNPI